MLKKILEILLSQCYNLEIAKKTTSKHAEIQVTVQCIIDFSEDLKKKDGNEISCNLKLNNKYKYTVS